MTFLFTSGRQEPDGANSFRVSVLTIGVKEPDYYLHLHATILI